jgi:hypothetical protein
MGKADQFNLDLTPCEEPASSESPARVVSFTDAATLAVRQEAVARVISSRIFELPVLPTNFWKQYR